MNDDPNAETNFLEGLSFSPDWAKETSSQNYIHLSAGKSFDEAPEDRRASHRGERPHRSGERDERRTRRPFRRDGGERHSGERTFEKGKGRDSRVNPVPHMPPEPIPYTARFIPDQGALDLISRRVFDNRRAMQLRKLVMLFFKEPDSVLVRLEMTPENKGKNFYQCKADGWVSLDEKELKAHLLKTQWDAHFEAKELVGEAPNGKFASVARCGITGKLLGPTSYHLFARAMNEILEGPCAGMSEQEYRSRLEFISDPEVIEQWRQEAAKQTVWVRKGREDEAEKTYTRAEAQDLFLREIAPGLTRTSPQVTLTHAQSKALSDARMLREIRFQWNREQNTVFGSLFFAVRSGLRSRKLIFFTPSGTRDEFVLHRVPTALAVQMAVTELRAILDYLTVHPGAMRTEVLEAVVPADASEEVQKAYRKQLDFAIERAHVIEYTNGVLALAEEHPFYRKVQPAAVRHAEAVPGEAAAVEPVAEAADAEEAPATAEEPVAEVAAAEEAPAT